MMEIPIFIINGFLDSGKTTFIVDAIEKDGFAKKGRTLVIQCEEGEIEISQEFVDKYNTTLIKVVEQVDLTPEYFSELATRYLPDRVILEMNCMWNMNEIYFPEGYRMAQAITFIDTSTFEVYYNNMRQKFKDMIEVSDLVVFNRCSDLNKITPYQTGLKLMNSNAQFMIMDDNGITKKAFEDPLPYDLNQEVITINDDDYGRWYIDTFENPERYKDRIVEFNALVTISKKLPKGSFIAGRYAMTCCADDVQLYGHLCKESLGVKIKNKCWVHIVARMTFEYSDEYQEEEGILSPISIKVIPPLKNPILDLR